MTDAQIAALPDLTPAELMTRVHALTIVVRNLVAAVEDLEAGVADLAAERAAREEAKEQQRRLERRFVLDGGRYYTLPPAEAAAVA